jgi:hypothetical protein
MLPISKVLKQEYILSPLLFIFDVEYAIRRVKENQDGLKLSGTHQPLVCADNVKYWTQAYVLQRKTRKLW